MLHTFGRDIPYHLDLHVVIPGGGMRDGEWKSMRPGFFVSVKLLSQLFQIEIERRRMGWFSALPELNEAF